MIIEFNLIVFNTIAVKLMTLKKALKFETIRKRRQIIEGM